MDLNLIDDVIVLLEEGNLSRAARRRNITQPAFSRRIQSFEAWLGRTIITRTPNRIEIEPALLANKEEMQALAFHIQALRRQISEYDPSRTTVTVAAQHSLIASTLADFVTTAQEHFPLSSFRVQAANQNDCISLFLTGEASLLICYEKESGFDMPFDSSVIRAVWGQDQLVPVVGGPLRFSLRFGNKAPVDTPVIQYPPQSFFGELLSERNAKPVSKKHSIVESAFSVGIKELALAGVGTAWLPMSMIHTEVQNGSLIICDNEAETVPLLITLYARPSDEPAARLCRLVD
ncbi:LysR family transcriptional regulator [Roseovarius sp. MMSF_3281]|uniref:LysR family transcriptional regulator n=1 Tax=Roseovarius sp. MMSF_3281 TaxID=3046694 RepID=UPI00273D2A69|nr:LysR family transcriptional regulator [Roseovarius sp. MMSF_3281]